MSLSPLPGPCRRGSSHGCCHLTRAGRTTADQQMAFGGGEERTALPTRNGSHHGKRSTGATSAVTKSTTQVSMQIPAGQLMDEPPFIAAVTQPSSSIASLLPCLTQGLRITSGLRCLALPEQSYLEASSAAVARCPARHTGRREELWELRPIRRWRPAGTRLLSYKRKGCQVLGMCLAEQDNHGPCKALLVRAWILLRGFLISLVYPGCI